LAKKSFLSEATVKVSYFRPKPRTTGTLSGASVPAGRSRGPWEPGVATGPDVGSAGATQMHVKVAGCGSRCRCLEHGPLHHTEPHGTTLTLTVLYTYVYPPHIRGGHHQPVLHRYLHVLEIMGNSTGKNSFHIPTSCMT